MTTTNHLPTPKWRAYLRLCKLNVVGHIVFTAIIGMFLAVPAPDFPPLALIFWTSLGIGLAAASAAALNHYFDREYDKHMRQDKASTGDAAAASGKPKQRMDRPSRPLPKGEITPREAVIFALVLAVLSMAILFFVNLLTAVLTFLSLIGYAVIYTVYLKHATPQNIVIGGAAGAAPPVLGWCAVTDSIHPYSLLLFLLIFVWTPPHFWAYAIAKQDIYAKVNIPMLPVTHGIPMTQLHVLLYTILLFIIGLFPYLTHMSGTIYLAAAVVFGGVFLYYAWRLKQDACPRIAMKTFAYSLVYLVGIFSALLVDHYIKF